MNESPVEAVLSTGGFLLSDYGKRTPITKIMIILTT